MATHSFNFTKEAIENLVPLPTEVFNVSDVKIRGLRLRINPGGSKTFHLYRKVHGRPVRFTIGRFPEITVQQARNKAIEVISKYNIGQDPAAEKAEIRNQLTFKEAWQRYYIEHALRNTKRPDDNKKMLEKHVFPIIGSTRLSDITKEKIKKVHTSVWSAKKRKEGEMINYSHADRIINTVSAIFNFVINEEYYKGANPCKGIKKQKSISRDRFLGSEELPKFFSSVDLEEPLFRDYFRLLLFTGARKTNVLSMKWSDIDFQLNRWRISETQTKNKDVNVVILSAPALNILHERKSKNDKLQKPSLYVFPGKGKNGYLNDPKRAFQRVRDRMGVQDIRMHDLRRTLGSYMAIRGISLPIIGKALNHKSQISTAIYARLSQSPVEDAVNLAADVFVGFK